MTADRNHAESAPARARSAPAMHQGRSAILPGATVGVLGTGQLGRMFAIAARRMGYRVHTFSPDRETPTGQVADVTLFNAVRVQFSLAGVTEEQGRDLVERFKRR